MALALRELGKDVQMVAADAAPPQFLEFPGVRDIQITQECRAVRRGHRDGMRRPVANRRRGLDKYFVINIDHHPGNKKLRARSTGSILARRHAARWCST
jgi:hypothetical protein